MTPDLPEYIICPRIGGSSVVPGARIRDCGTCKEPVWIAPSSEPFFAQGVPLMCLECLLERPDLLKEGPLAPTPEQLAEIERYFQP